MAPPARIDSCPWLLAHAGGGLLDLLKKKKKRERKKREKREKRKEETDHPITSIRWSIARSPVDPRQ